MKDIDSQYVDFKEDIGRMATYILGSSNYSEDIVQEVFVQILKGKSQFKGKSTYKTYILGITKNVAKGYIKKMAKEGRVLKSAADQYQDNHTIQSVDFNLILNKALKTIKSKYRLPLLLKELEGLSYQEISEVLKINLGTVKSRINYGKGKLLEFLNSKQGGRG